MPLRILLIIFASILTASCSTMSKKDCLNADWYNYGYQDGQAGMAASRVNNYVQLCSKHDIGINQSDYLSGHSQGIRIFCQPNTAYQLGLKGRTMPQVCPADLQSEFSNAYTRGFNEYKIKRDITAAKKALQQGLKDQTTAEAQLIDATARLYAKTSGENNSQEQQAINKVNQDLQAATAAQVVAIGQQACASGDWYQAGEQDGLAGRSASLYKQHVRQCQSYHPAANQRDYIKGQSAGIQSYCSYDNGLMIGQTGRALSNLCQGMAARELNRGYEKGLLEFDKKVSIAGLEIRSQGLNQSVQQLENQLDNLEQKLANPQLPTNEKLALSRQLAGVKYDLDIQSQELKTARNELDCYVADWLEYGFIAGEKGEVFNNPSLNCAAFGIETNTNSFVQGYQSGLQRYCNEDNGRALGALGEEYQNVCPASLAPAFLRGYQPAFAAYQRAQLKKQLAIELAQDEKRLANIQNEIDVLGLGLEQTGISRAEKLAIINEMSALNREENALIEQTQKSSAHLQCLTDDWFGLGKEHGEQGLRSQLLALDCRRFGLTDDSSQYRNGLSRGRDQWCVASRGQQDGEAGAAVSEVCSRSAHPDYFRGYSQGKAALEQQQKIDQLRLQKLDLIEAQTALTADISELDYRLQNTQLPPLKRRELNAQLLKKQAQLAELELDLEQVKRQLFALGE